MTTPTTVLHIDTSTLRTSTIVTKVKYYNILRVKTTFSVSIHSMKKKKLFSIHWLIGIPELDYCPVNRGCFFLLRSNHIYTHLIDVTIFIY